MNVRDKINWRWDLDNITELNENPVTVHEGLTFIDVSLWTERCVIGR